MNWTVKDIPSQSGRFALITGANGAIGFPIALELARSGAEILLPARTLEKSLDTVQRIRSIVPDANLIPGVLDVASLASIYAFVHFYQDRFTGQSLDLLINNAGVMGPPQRELTTDGFELQFATNYLGPFALTALLFKHLKPLPTTRIVAVAAAAFFMNGVKIDFGNLQAEREYKPKVSLPRSKLAVLTFMIELQRRLSTAGSPIVSVSAHPGLSLAENVLRNMTGLSKIVAPRMISLIGHSAAQAALPVLFAATSPNVEPGGCYGPGGFKELKGYPASAKIPGAATDKAVASRLRAETERLTGVQFDLGFVPTGDRLRAHEAQDGPR